MNTVGEKIAALASAMSVTCHPEKRLKAPEGNPWAWQECEIVPGQISRLEKYRKLGEEVRALTSTHNKAPEDRWDNWAWASCHQAVGVIVRAVADRDFAMDRPEVLPGYAAERPGQWACIGTVNDTRDALLQPGDILNVTEPKTHTCIYLGQDAAQLHHPGTQGVIWEASYNSERALYPGITDKGIDGPLETTYTVYRYIGEPDGAVDVKEYL